MKNVKSNEGLTHNEIVEGANAFAEFNQSCDVESFIDGAKWYRDELEVLEKENNQKGTQ